MRIRFSVHTPIAANLDQMQEAFRRREERDREIIAISRSSSINIGETKVMDRWKGRWRTLEDAHGRLSAMTQRLADDIRQRGDRRIAKPTTVAAQFFSGVRARAEAGMIGGDTLSDDALLPAHVERSDISPETTLNEMGDLSAFRGRLLLANEFLGAPWPELKQRVTEERLPSTLIQSLLRRYAQDLPERKGSELIDRYLACLAPYADETYVDKRTHEAMCRAGRKSPAFVSLTRSVRKASGYGEIARQLDEAESRTD